MKWHTILNMYKMNIVNTNTILKMNIWFYDVLWFSGKCVVILHYQ